MKRSFGVACLLVLSIALSVAPSANARPFTAKDLAMLDRVSDPRLSPDGQRIAYNQRSTDWEANGGLHALKLIDASGTVASGTAAKAIVEKEKAPTSPRFSRDGSALYFLSGKSGTRQLWRASADGSAPTQITDFPLGIASYQLSADGSRLIFSLEVTPSCATLACSRAKQDEKAATKATGLVIEGQARFWDAYRDGRTFALFSAPAANAVPPKEATPLMQGFAADVPARPEGTDASFAITPDGKTVIFTSRNPESVGALEGPSSLYSVPADGKSPPIRLRPSAMASETRPTLSPDGKSLAFIAQTGEDGTYSRTALMLLDMRTGSVSELGVGKDWQLGALRWSADGSRLLATSADTGQSKLISIPANGAAPTALVETGTVGDFDTARDASGDATAYVQDSLTAPGEILLATRAGTRKLTAVGAATLAASPMAAAEQFSFTGWNGNKVYGYIVQPQGFVPGRTYPVAFLIHGGPHGSFGDSWSYRWNPQVWSGMGYAVVMIDFHGSSGYGEAFGRAVIGHWGDRPLEDLQRGWKHVLAAYPWLDGNRACALGGSYGGYMVNWMAGQWNAPWKCLVNHAGIFDTLTMAYTTDIPSFSISHMQGKPWADPEAFARFNPANHVAQWKTPMLVIHGARDFRVPVDQGIAASTANVLRKIPTRLLIYPDENHWVLKPQNSVLWYRTVEDWMQQYTSEPTR